MKRRNICCIILTFLILILLTGCKENSENLEINKVISQIRFLENQYISIFNKYISDYYLSENNQIDWNLVNEDFDVLKNSYDVILMDLASLNVSSKNIVEFENNFIDLENYLKDRDSNNFLKKICDNYNFVSSSIFNNISNNDEIKLEKKAKTDLIYVGYYLIINNKNDIATSLNQFQNDFSELIKNTIYVENNSYKINKIFLESQKLNSKLNNEDIEGMKDDLLNIMEYF